MGTRLQTYEAPGITVTFDPGVCIPGAAGAAHRRQRAVKILSAVSIDRATRSTA